MKRTLHRTLRWMTLLVTAAAFSPAHANDGPYIGFEGGYNVERDLILYDINNDTSDRLRFKDGPLGDDGVVGGLVFGHAFWFGLRPELAFDYRRNQLERSTNSLNLTNTNVSGRQELYSAMGNLWYDIKTPTGFFSVVHPYLGAGIGWGRLSLRSPSINDVYGADSFDSALAWQFGTGIGIDLNRVVTLTADYRHVRTRGQRLNFDGQADGRYRADSAMLGVRFHLGSPPREVVVVQAPVRTPPPPPPPPAPDRCAMDADGDGVGDCEDKCANTPSGFKVDRTGCIVEQSVILRSINFVFNKDQLTVPAQETLDEVAAALVGQPALNVQIKGHTDSVGTDAYNRALSQRRADSVRRYLVSKGVLGANLQAIGAGEDQPIAGNDSEEGRAQNRRVEFVVLNKPANVSVKSAESTSRSKQAAEAGEPARVKNHMKHR
jgi:OmpA-OmpF porin, OOP family